MNFEPQKKKKVETRAIKYVDFFPFIKNKGGDDV